MSRKPLARMIPMKIILFSLLFLMSCRTKDNIPLPRQSLESTVVSGKSHQTVEGRLLFSETIVVLGAGSRLIKSLETSLSGSRTHVFKNGVVKLEDNFNKVSILSQFKMDALKEKFNGLIISQPLDKNDEKTVSITMGNSKDPYKIKQFIKPLYSFMHALPKDKSGKPQKIHTGLKWSFTDSIIRIVNKKPVTIHRKFNFIVKKIAHDGQLHLVTLAGSSISTSNKPITMGEFTVEIVGVGKMEVEFSLDKGVWTHVKGNEVLGWAGTYLKKGTKTPITTGYRQELKMDLYLTENK
jgi:hypothetical protein